MGTLRTTRSQRRSRSRIRSGRQRSPAGRGSRLVGKSGDVEHECVAGEIDAMAGGSVEHSALCTTLAGLLLAHLRGGPCRPHGPDLRLRIPAVDVGSYADASVVCDPVERDPESPTHVLDPRVVVEVLSPPTERYDREQKRL